MGKNPLLWPRKRHCRLFSMFIDVFIDLDLIVLGFNDTSTLKGHFVSSPLEREKRDRRDSRRDEREGQGRKLKTFPLYPYLLQG